MKNLIRIVALLSFIARGDAAAQSVQNEGLVRELGPGWTSLYEISPDLRYDAIELVPNGYNWRNWKEVASIADFLGSSNLSAEDTLKEHQAKREKKCPGAVQWSAISKDETGFLFQWHIGVCGNLPEEDEVGRVMVGKYSRYILEYAARVHELSPETRAHWIKTFSDATFDSVTLSFDSAWMSVDVDEIVPFAMDKVMAALTPAMESQSCKVSSSVAGRIECKRPRVLAHQQPDMGAESVTALLEPKGDQTEVHITTGLGFYGRLAKKNWSTPIYEAMMKNLQTTQP
jgi:hypothetical protein